MKYTQDADLMCIATMYCGPSVLETLIRHGAKVEGQDPFQTPLGTAVGEGRRDNTEFLLKQGADPTRKQHYTPMLRWARECNRPELIPLLKQYGARE